ncbi:hypothetical protein SCP_1000550 [Sparassis crispa]|uniref:Uncharacterized protein n=1 Tax=Sparassis crispa TaxID=139825 RepID=A0A401GX96_9APHY|nr:hypothetical protein SCP_1000550 [Sparassis crispa]GBE86813.1 hypothetical protein SCP_1000550 [Sparassis crispa]
MQKAIHDSAISSIEEGEAKAPTFAGASPEPSIPPGSAFDSESEGQVDDAGETEIDIADSAGDSREDLDYIAPSSDAEDEDEDLGNDSDFDVAMITGKLGGIDAGDEGAEDIGMEPAGLSRSMKGTWKKFLASETARKEKNKKNKTALKSQIIDKHKEALTAPARGASSTATKCKAPASEKLAHENKCAKVVETGGLKPGWRRYLARSDNSSKTSLTHSGESDAPIEGEFDKDEGTEVLRAVRATHQTDDTQREGFTATNLVKIKPVGIVLKPAVIAEIDKKERGAGHVNKQAATSWSNKDLPFPAAWRRQLLVWHHSDFKSTVRLIWMKIFIDLPELDVDGKLRSEHPAIHTVAQAALRTYRSDIGKTALRIIDTIWESADMVGNYTTVERRKAWIKAHLNNKNFLYLDPESTVHLGTFRGPLITETFAYHLQLIIKSEVDYGEPTGALALCTAAVQRALTVWKEGMNSLKEPDGSACRGGARNFKESFKDEPWGNEAKIYYNRTKGLKEPKNNNLTIDLTADSSEGGANVDDDIRMSEDDD